MWKPSSKALAYSSLLLLTHATQTFAAGCIATRGADMHHSFYEQSPVAQPALEEHHSRKKPSRFEATIATRHFVSDRTFIGKDEQKQNRRDGTEVINNSHFVDFSLTYFINGRWSTNITVPFADNERSQVARSSSGKMQRFATQATGLGDIRATGNFWVFDPAQAPKGNIQLGFGLDLPTGDKDNEDIFMRYDLSTGKMLAEKHTVDQSIQPGDGGWGLILNAYGYRQLASQWTMFLNTAYTITPEEKNGVKTFSTNPYEAEMSISDSYLARAGVDFLAWPENKLRTSLSLRMAGVPVHDITGGSGGFRRPGYDISIEPGVSMDIRRWSFNLSVPVAFERNRQQSVPEKQFANSTGLSRQEDAGFADYEILLSVSKRF